MYKIVGNTKGHTGMKYVAFNLGIAEGIQFIVFVSTGAARVLAIIIISSDAGKSAD